MGVVMLQAQAGQHGVNGAIKAAFVACGNPLNVATWSGSPFNMLRALGNSIIVEQVIEKPFSFWFRYVRRGLQRLSRGRYDIYWSPVWTRLATTSTRRRLGRSGCDVVIVAGATPICYHLCHRARTVFISDATFASMKNYNATFRKLSPRIKNVGEDMETTAIRNSLVALFPSKWATSSAIVDHGASPSTTYAVPWGANLKPIQPVPAQERDMTSWRILFVGVDWEGKGGDIAVETIRILRERGFPAHLDVVGSAPSSPPPEIEGITFHGFLSKNDPQQLERLQELYRNAHLFILPTQFEALAVVIAEAASYGIPSVVYRTGGVETNVVHGDTGLTIPPGAPPKAFADAVESILSRPRRYRKMCNNAVRYSAEALNWTAWAERVNVIIRDALADPASKTVPANDHSVGLRRRSGHVAHAGAIAPYRSTGQQPIGSEFGSVESDDASTLEARRSQVG